MRTELKDLLSAVVARLQSAHGSVPVRSLVRPDVLPCVLIQGMEERDRRRDKSGELVEATLMIGHYSTSLGEALSLAETTASALSTQIVLSDARTWEARLVTSETIVDTSGPETIYDRVLVVRLTAG